jgi:hypothetical protein
LELYLTRKKGTFRNTNVNSVFSLIADLTGILEENKKGLKEKNLIIPFCGERGIRTLGTSCPVRQFSKLFLSASQASLRVWAAKVKKSLATSKFEAGLKHNLIINVPFTLPDLKLLCYICLNLQIKNIILDILFEFKLHVF